MTQSLVSQPAPPVPPASPAPFTRPRTPRAQRFLLAGCGVVCVGVGAIGVFVPGLPTTIFLIIASWCFARSCPWLEDRLIRNRLFSPFLRYLDSGQPMPRRAKIASIIVMWTAIAISSALIVMGNASLAWIAAILFAAGAVGTWVILRFRSADGVA